jgi:hypothetical protein
VPSLAAEFWRVPLPMKAMDRGTEMHTLRLLALLMLAGLSATSLGCMPSAPPAPDYSPEFDEKIKKDQEKADQGERQQSGGKKGRESE